MKRKLSWLLTLPLLVMPFLALECTESRTTDTVLNAKITTHWHSEGFTETTHSDTRVVNKADDIKKALDDLDANEIQSIDVSGVCYEVIANAGSAARHAARHSGSVTVDGHPLLTFNSPDTNPGTKGDPGNGGVVMNSDGLVYIQNKLNDYLAAYNAGTADANAGLLNNITFAATWESMPLASEPDPDNFDWDACVMLQIVAKLTFDVPKF